MRTWWVYALLAMVTWGCYIVVAKVATSQDYCGLSSKWAALLMYVGIGLTFAGYWFFSSDQQATLNAKSILAGTSTGILWGLGMIFSFCALRSGADVAKLVPIFNSNTLVAVLLGLLLFKEATAPSDILRIVLGAVLIVGGGVLIAR